MLSLVFPVTCCVLGADWVLKLRVPSSHGPCHQQETQPSLTDQRAPVRPQGGSYCSRSEGCLYLRLSGRLFTSKKGLLVLYAMSTSSLRGTRGIMGHHQGQGSASEG